MPLKDTMLVLEHGSWNIKCTWIGKRTQIPSCGYMAFVSKYDIHVKLKLHALNIIVAGAGKTVVL